MLLHGTPSSSPFMGIWTSIGIGRLDSFAMTDAMVLPKFLDCCNFATLWRLPLQSRHEPCQCLPGQPWEIVFVEQQGAKHKK